MRYTWVPRNCIFVSARTTNVATNVHVFVCSILWHSVRSLWAKTSFDYQRNGVGTALAAAATTESPSPVPPPHAQSTHSVFRYTLLHSCRCYTSVSTSVALCCFLTMRHKLSSFFNHKCLCTLYRGFMPRSHACLRLRAVIEEFVICWCLRGPFIPLLLERQRPAGQRHTMGLRRTLNTIFRVLDATNATSSSNPSLGG